MKRSYRRGNNRLITIIALSIALICSGYLVGGKEQSSITPSQQFQNNNNIGGISAAQYRELSNIDYHQGEKAVRFVNHNNSTLKVKSWKSNKIVYQNLDRLNRASGSNTAFLDKRNIANQQKRSRQNIKPTGWHYPYRNGVQVYNRGHLIAYSLSGHINQFGKYTNDNEGDQNNPRNLFTQTAYANQKLQTIYETEVRHTLLAGQRVIYQATPIFRGNELMARGINLQAKSVGGMLNFNVYILNVQPGYVFNYQNGSVKRL